MGHPLPGIAPAALLHHLTLLFCTSTNPAVSQAPGVAGPIGKGQEPGGIPAAPRQPPASQAHCQGQEQMAPLGTAARHSVGSLGTARHGTAPPAGGAPLRPWLPGHRFGFPKSWSRCRCRPCQDCPMSPNPPPHRAVTHTRADTPQTFLAINRPPLRTERVEPHSLLRSCPPVPPHLPQNHQLGP